MLYLQTLTRIEFGGFASPPQFSCSLTAEAGRIKPGLPWPLSEAPRHFCLFFFSFPRIYLAGGSQAAAFPDPSSIFNLT
jgi:hypothetical protein